MSNLLVVALIFSATFICNALGVVYQRLIFKDQHFKATVVSVVMAGLGLFVWKLILKDSDLDGTAALISYLTADGLGVYTGLKVKIDKEHHKIK